MNSKITALISEFSHQKGVISITIGGSRSTNSHDSSSDYDIYIYTNKEISPGVRDSILSPISQKLELNNRFWETEDNLILNDGSYIDIIYRNVDWFEGELDRVLTQHIASTGYTTCLWFNLLNSNIAFDSRDYYKRLQSRYNIEYPEQLVSHIIEKNLPLITDSIPSYINQVEKAVNRNDLISVNHRVSGFFASYFDIIYSINRLPHPGEKRLIENSLRLCKTLPVNFKSDITKVLEYNPISIVNDLKKISKNLISILN